MSVLTPGNPPIQFYGILNVYSSALYESRILNEKTLERNINISFNL